MGNVLNYKQELTKAMAKLAEHPKTIFVGQSIEYDGQAAFDTFSGVPKEKKLELPVAEEFQMGFCTGLAIEGYIPVCFYPRFDFLLLAANQLVNHLDKFREMTNGVVSPKVIIRVAVGSRRPLNPGPQHTQDHTSAFSAMLSTIPILRMPEISDIKKCYDIASNLSSSCLMVEYMGKYNA